MPIVLANDDPRLVATLAQNAGQYAERQQDTASAIALAQLQQQAMAQRAALDLDRQRLDLQRQHQAFAQTQAGQALKLEQEARDEEERARRNQRAGLFEQARQMFANKQIGLDELGQMRGMIHAGQNPFGQPTQQQQMQMMRAEQMGELEQIQLREALKGGGQQRPPGAPPAIYSDDWRSQKEAKHKNTRATLDNEVRYAEDELRAARTAARDAATSEEREAAARRLATAEQRVKEARQKRDGHIHADPYALDESDEYAQAFEAAPIVEPRDTNFGGVDLAKYQHEPFLRIPDGKGGYKLVDNPLWNPAARPPADPRAPSVSIERGRPRR